MMPRRDSGRRVCGMRPAPISTDALLRRAATVNGDPRVCSRQSPVSMFSHDATPRSRVASRRYRCDPHRCLQVTARHCSTPSDGCRSDHAAQQSIRSATEPPADSSPPAFHRRGITTDQQNPRATGRFTAANVFNPAKETPP